MNVAIQPKEVTYVSSSMRLVSTGGVDSESCVGDDVVGAAVLLFSGSSSGFGCIRVNGSSATRSLQ